MVQLDPNSLSFPDPRSALGPETDAPGLLAIGGDLRPERLLAAYRQGIFPWFGENQPILWWCLNPRMVLKTRDFKLHRSLRKTLQAFLHNPQCQLRVNADPVGTLQDCARAPRAGQSGTWIVPAMQHAYTELARRGVLQSVETWRGGQRIGGLYGLRIGRMFFGESMFSNAPDASKLALSYLVALCRRDGIEWIDCQQATAHLAHMGAAPVPLEAFLHHIHRATAAPELDPWAYDPSAWSQVMPTP
ncbi:leucyl/phenylalanyl-tRNA--protein transferase [Inhella sp. 4Y17]|uniref:Leucyl/phenylalanyl-tRNA--protein transferase n=1 Tax=Inhella gelatinilytica TaxID=2795030 RepID=A0A931IU90_9BURK|nr:leucyl/phenylalanyl-tRNA--protein transferase [Inhella gelatinilytica]MBH9552877.1 leucyl/phenylalanyl-tRNA--protein transferase [Inhella gelatinilytica]